MSRMNFEHLIALVEECHRFRDLPFQRVSLAALCGDDRLIDEYIAVLLRAVRENGMQRDRCALNMLGTELVEAVLLLWMLRCRPCGRETPDGTPAGRRLRKDRAVNRQKWTTHISRR